MSPGAGSFRLVTYNMLADFYVQLHRSNGVDYLPPQPYQDIEYRKQGLLLELIGADRLAVGWRDGTR